MKMVNLRHNSIMSLTISFVRIKVAGVNCPVIQPF